MEQNKLIAFETAVTAFVNKVGSSGQSGWVTTTSALETMVKQMAFEMAGAGQLGTLEHLTNYLNKRTAEHV